MIADWGADASRQMFFLAQKQALVSIPLALSMVLAAWNPWPGLRLQDALGVAVLIAAIAGEGLSDAQLRRFRADPANRNRICDAGLWGWSRHPNYFFEWFGWLAYPLLAIDLSGAYPWGWAALVGPACMYWLSGPRLRHSAAGGAHAGAPARRIPRLPGAHQCVLPGAAADHLREATHELRADDDRIWRKRAAARRGDAGGDQIVGRADAAAAVARRNDADRRFARDMAPFPIAVNTAEANAQHYEIPADFFNLVLGPQRKYSSCLYEDGIDTLAAAEERALQVSAEHAALADGQRILELGCGWGSLSLWMARHYPAARITAVSNSHSQREFIAGRAKAEGLANLTVITADMNAFQPQNRFDRVVSVEMFEHMANWRPLLQRLRDCLEPDGRMFMHVFANRHASYRFAADDKEDWIAQHYFTGGIMPSRNLIRQFPDCFAVDAEWWWNGRHYRRTAQHWLDNFDRNADAVFEVLKRVYGRDARLWQRRWRLFFLATMGLFGHAAGEEWGVSHYRLTPVR